MYEQKIENKETGCKDHTDIFENKILKIEEKCH